MSIISNLIGEDARVEEGLRAQLRRRDSLLEAGAERVGWKLAFGSEEAKRRWDVPGPVVGHLTTATLLPEGAGLSIADWAAPVLEPEIAVVAGVDADGPRVDGIALAIELADLGGAGEDLAATIAGNIYHRAFLLGATRSFSGPPEVAVMRGAEQSAVQTDPFGAVGAQPEEFVEYVSTFLAAHGEVLADGDVLLTGSVVPPLRVAPGERIEVRSDRLGALAIELGDEQA